MPGTGVNDAKPQPVGSLGHSWSPPSLLNLRESPWYPAAMKASLRAIPTVLSLALLSVLPGLASEAPYYFALARMYAAEGSVERAAEAFGRAIELEPDDSYLRFEHAEFLSRRGLLRQAVREVETSLDIDSENYDALRLFGYLHLELTPRDPRSVRRAREAFEKLREVRPEDVATMVTLSRIYQRIGEESRALDVLEESLSWAPDHPTLKARVVEALAWSEVGGRASEILERMLGRDPGFSEARLALARRYSGQGLHEDAIRLLEQDSSEGAGSRGGFLLAIELYRQASMGDASWALQQEYFRRSGELIETLLEGQPDNQEALFLRALILSAVSRNGDAIEELQVLRRSAPSRSAPPEFQLRVVGKLAELLEHEGRSPEATRVLSALAEGLNRAGNDSEASDRVWLEVVQLEARERHWDEVAKVAKRLMACDDEQLRIEGAWFAAQAALQQKRYGEALKILSRHDPERAAPRLLLKRVEVLLEDGRQGQAEEEISRFLADENLDRLLAVSEFYLRREDFESALPVLERSLTRASATGQPELSRELVLLSAEALEELGRFDRALKLLDERASDFREAEPLEKHRLRLARAGLLESAARDDEASLLYAQIQEATHPREVRLTVEHYQGRENYEGMIPVLERALRFDDEEGESRMPEELNFALGVAFERSGKIEEAVASFRRVLALNPDDSRTLNYLGYTWADRDENLEEALELILRAVELEPRNGAYLDSLGWIYYRLDRFEEALVPLQSAASLVPNDATILEHMGDLYAALEDLPKASELYRQALAVNDENVEGIRQKLARLETEDL